MDFQGFFIIVFVAKRTQSQLAAGMCLGKFVFVLINQFSIITGFTHIFEIIIISLFSDESPLIGQARALWKFTCK